MSEPFSEPVSDSLGSLPDVADLFEHQSFRRCLGELAISRLSNREGIACLIGAKGVGKSTLLARLLAEPEAAAACLALVGDHRMTFSGFLKICAQGFGLPSEFENPEGHLRALGALLVEHSRSGRAGVVIIDQAERLNRQFLQELIEFSAWIRAGHRLCHVVLAVRSDRDGNLGPRFQGLKTAWSFELRPLTCEELIGYVAHKLKDTGLEATSLFTEEAMVVVMEESEGIPAAIDAILSRVLAARASEGSCAMTGAELREFLAHEGETTQEPEAQPAASLSPAVLSRLSEIDDLVLEVGEPEATPPCRPSRTGGSRYARLSRWAAGFGVVTVAALVTALFLPRLVVGPPATQISDAPEVVFDSSLDTENRQGNESSVFSMADPSRDPLSSTTPRIAPPRAVHHDPEATAGGVGTRVHEAVRLSGTLSVKPSEDPLLPTLRVKQATGREDEPIPLYIDVERGNGLGRNDLVVMIDGLPDSARLSAGTSDAVGVWHLGPEDLTGLRLTPPRHHSGKHRLIVKAVVERPGGSKLGVSQSLPLEIAGVVDTPMLRLKAESGYEDRPVALGIEAELADPDGSEVLDIEISAVPEGAVVSADTPLGVGPWRLTAGDLERLTLIPPPDWSGTALLDVVFRVRERDGEEKFYERRLAVEVLGRVDEPLLTVRDVAGSEGEAVRLAIEAATSDVDGSEDLVVRVVGLPKGARLSAGSRDAEHGWFLGPDDLTDLELILPPFFAGPVELEVTAIAREGLDSLSVTRPMNVEIVPSINNALIAQMIKQGDELMRSKDLVAARLFYEEAARRGHAKAMTAVGLTYDPNEFKKLGIGVGGANEKMARHWYLRGIAAGDSEAAHHLSALGKK